MTMKRLKTLLENTKPAAILLVGLVGLLLLFLSGRQTDREKPSPCSEDRLAAYTEETEARLASILGGIAGAGKTKVMIEFESSFESVYANNARLEENTGASVSAISSGGRTTQKEIVLAGGASQGEEPILLKELCPKVKGILVVCEGGADAGTREAIRQAAAQLFHISASKVCVVAGDPAHY